MNSKQAHEDLIKSGRKETLHRLIMQFFHKYKEGTFSDAARYLKLNEHETWRRFSELAKEGKILKTSDSKLSLTTNKKLTVWRLIE